MTMTSLSQFNHKHPRFFRLRQRAINDKSCPKLTMSIHDSSGNAGGAAQILQANAINDMSHPNSTTNIHDSSGYAGGAAQIPLLQVTLEALPKFHR